MTLCGYGRLTEKETTDSLKTPLPKDVVPCTDRHASYVKYASGNHLEHVVLKGKRGQHVKRTGIPHTACQCAAQLVEMLD